MVVAACLVSCGERRSKEQLALINEGFDRTDSFIRDANSRMYEEFEDRQYDPRAEPYVVRWSPGMSTLRSSSRKLHSYLDSLAAEVKDGGALSTQKRNELGAVLRAYTTTLLTCFDTVVSEKSDLVKKDYAQRKKRLPLLKDSGMLDKDPSITLELLNSLRTTVRLSENEMLRFCMVGSDWYTDAFEKFQVVASLSSAHVRAGEPIAVSAGLGSFNPGYKPKITIGGRVVKVAFDDDVALDTIATKGKQGRYALPIVIEYTMPDGGRSRIFRTLIYTVDRAH